jgi:hypothetical protein
MVAAKLPLHLYEAYMKELHYDQPLMEEQKLAEAVVAAQQRAQDINAGSLLLTEEGQAALGHAPPVPNFSSQTGET